MKKYILACSFVAVILFLTSCEKDEGKLPNIAFKTGSNYTSADANTGQGTSVTIGIDASKSEDKDVLISFDISVSYDGGTSNSVYSETLTGTSGDIYSYDYNFTTRQQAGTETYTFTVINRDGLKNQVSLTLTVN